MAKPMNRAERKAAYLKQAEQFFEEMEGWYDDHPEATFEEIEQETRQQRRKLMGESLEILVNGRDVGKEEKAPVCGGCGEPLVYKGEVKKTIYGVEGETKLERSYYHCPNRCEGSAFFPSGQEAEA